MKKLKVLIIDDEEDFCHVIGSFLEKKGYEVELSFTLQEGLRLIAEKEPDILFLDNQLPDGEGWQQTEFLRENYSFLHIHLITAYKENMASFHSHSNVRVWEKPLSFNKLQEVLDAMSA